MNPIYKNYKDRCEDCAYLVEGNHGEWRCDSLQKPCSDIYTCQEGLDDLPEANSWEIRCTNCIFCNKNNPEWTCNYNAKPCADITDCPNIYNLIMQLFEDAVQDWKTIDNEEFIKHVCEHTNLTSADYRRIMMLPDIDTENTAKQTYMVPFAYERYGRMPVQAHSEKEAWEKAEKQLENMTVSDMDVYAEYLQDSEELDREGDLILQPSESQKE